MKAVVQNTYGSAEVLEVRDIDKPAPTDDGCWCGCTRPAWIPVSGT